MQLNPEQTADLVTCTKKILNGKLHFFMQGEHRFYDFDIYKRHQFI